MGFLIAFFILVSHNGTKVTTIQRIITEIVSLSTLYSLSLCMKSLFLLFNQPSLI
jgi:hypothetical protein